MYEQNENNAKKKGEKGKENEKKKQRELCREQVISLTRLINFFMFILERDCIPASDFCIADFYLFFLSLIISIFRAVTVFLARVSRPGDIQRILNKRSKIMQISAILSSRSSIKIFKTT